MIGPDTRRVVGLLVGLPALSVFPAFVRWLLSLGGTPEAQGIATVYQIKPMMRFMSWIAAAGGVALCWQAYVSWGQGVGAALTELTVAVACFFLAIMVPSQVILDEEGIRYHRILCRDAFVSWRDLNHVEKRTVYARGTMGNSTVYFYRGSNDASVPVDAMGFSAEDILQRVRERHKCPEQPYRKRYRYGG
jgi:hypothetical protein